LELVIVLKSPVALYLVPKCKRILKADPIIMNTLASGLKKIKKIIRR
jgi:hypothetical protein